jgi:hypothetical protein
MDTGGKDQTGEQASRGAGESLSGGERPDGDPSQTLVSLACISLLPPDASGL